MFIIKKFRKILCTILVLCLCLSLTACGNKVENADVQHDFFAMDTVITLKIPGEGNPENIANLATDVENIFANIEERTSRHTEKGKENISEVNANAGIKPVKVTDDVFDLVKLSLEYSEKTNGEFSIAIGPVIDLWQNCNQVPPSKEVINEALKISNYKDVVLDEENKTIYLTKKGMMLDLGAVAKGYAVKVATDYLKNNNVKSAFLNAGGSLYTIGSKPDGKPWTVGIAHPRNNQDLSIVLEVNDLSIISSGDYQRYFEYEGERYHHIIDPKTGYPSKGMTNVAIVSKDPTLADILSTTIFIMGLDSVNELLPNDEEILLIDSDLNAYATEGFMDYAVSDFGSNIKFKEKIAK